MNFKFSKSIDTHIFHFLKFRSQNSLAVAVFRIFSEVVLMIFLCLIKLLDSDYFSDYFFLKFSLISGLTFFGFLFLYFVQIKYCRSILSSFICALLIQRDRIVNFPKKTQELFIRDDRLIIFNLDSFSVICISFTNLFISGVF